MFSSKSPAGYVSAIAVLVLSAPVNVPSARAEGAAPHAVVHEIGHDFGPIEPGGTLAHTFGIRNDGMAPLRILRVEGSQPGMRSHFTELLAPGESGRITIEWNPPGSSGDVRADAVVYLSDPQRPRVTLTLTGILRQSIRVQPSPDVFVSLFPDESAERRVTIVNAETRPLAITRLRPAGDHFSASLNTVDAGRTYEVVVKVPAGLRPGRYVDDLYVDTDHPRLGPLHLSVNTFVKSGLYATPEAVDFGDLSLERIRTFESAPWLVQSATLRKRKGDFAIVSMSSDIDGLRVDRSPLGRSDTIGLIVTLDRHRLHPGDLDGAIQIRTDDPEFPIVTLPVRGRIR